MSKLRNSIMGGALAALALTACGDDAKPGNESPDAAQPIDAPAPPTDAPTPYTPPTPFAVALSAAGPDQLQSAVAAPNGGFYAAGFAAQTLTGPKLVTVVKITAAGALDLSFSGDGIATTDIAFVGGNGEVGIGVQPSGKIIVSATVASATSAVQGDRDVVVARLSTDGTLDNTFGDAGKRVLPLNDAVRDDAMNAVRGLDAARGVAIGAGGVIYAYALQRGEGAGTCDPNPSTQDTRCDTDVAVVKLTVDGAVANDFAGTDGKYLFGFTGDNLGVNEVARGINVLSDGSVLASGYARTAGFGTDQPLLIRLSSAGEPVNGFASGGIYHDQVLAKKTEIYNVAVHGDYVVTGGYGHPTSDANDWVSLRFNTMTGARDTSWGGATNGAVLIDPAGMMAGDNCRGAIALPGGRTALHGSTGPNNMDTQDAVFAVLDSTGKPDTSFGAGVHVYQLGGNDSFWGGAVNGNRALMVGFKGGGATPTDTINDNAYAVVLSLP